MPPHDVPNDNFPQDSEHHPAVFQCPQWARYCLLAFIAIHVLGVLTEPLRFFSRSEVRTGPEFSILRQVMQPYSQWLYMDHGYFFFAPNPGPAHLIQCNLAPTELVTKADDKPEQPLPPSDTLIIFPNRHQQWPRLSYHRHFMLSEFYNSRYAPKQVTEELKKDPAFMEQWTFDRALYDQIQSSITKSLRHSTGATKVELRRVERLIPEVEQVLREGWGIDDPRLTELLLETMIEPSKPSAEKPAKRIELGELPPKEQTAPAQGSSLAPTTDKEPNP